MRILFLDHGTTYGGGQVMAARLLPLLSERFEIDALTGCDRIEGRPIPESMHGLRRAMRGYDLIYANTPRTAIAAATTRLPFLWHKHHPGSSWAQRIAAQRARRVISVARFGAPRGDHVRVIPNGVPPMRAEPAQGLPKGKRILVLGRLHPEKGHDLAVSALALMDTEAQLLVAGPGHWAPPPVGNVHLLGMRDDVAELLAACDVLLLPSRCDEGAPLSVLEAQAAGVPIVATRVGGVPEVIVEGRTAFLVPKEEPRAMAEALDRALRVDRATWGDPSHAARYTLRACVDRISEVIVECVAGVTA